MLPEHIGRALTRHLRTVQEAAPSGIRTVRLRETARTG